MIAKDEIEKLLPLNSDLLTNEYCGELLARLETEEIEDDILGFDGATKKKVFAAFLSGIYRISEEKSDPPAEG